MDTTLNDSLPQKHSRFMKVVPYIFCFFIFSFIGWVLETIFCYCVLGRFIERGFLYSPICPIYRNRSFYFNSIFR